MKSPSFRRPPSIKHPGTVKLTSLHDHLMPFKWRMGGLNDEFSVEDMASPKRSAGRSPVRGVMRFSHWRMTISEISSHKFLGNCDELSCA